MNTANDTQPARSTPWLNRFAWLNAIATFFLLIAGALVTSHRAGLSVPDWPNTFGYFMFSFPWSKTVGGIFYEHGHRLIASSVGLLTVLLCGWLFKTESRPWVRWLGVGAVGLVIVQGVLGGLTVLHDLPPALSAAHATLAQTFFCVTITLAACTGRAWRNDSPICSSRAGMVRFLTAIATAAVFLQLILGAMIRHSEHGIAAHIGGGMLVLVTVFVTAVVILLILGAGGYFRHSLFLALLVIGQVGLGFKTLAVHIPKNATESLSQTQILLPTIHLAIGALILGVTFALALRCHRFLEPTAESGSLPMTPEGASR